MRILVVNFQDRLHPYAGGAEVHLHHVFGRLARRGHDITLLSSAWTGARRRETVDGIDIHRVGSRASFPWHAPQYFRRELHHGRPPWDVIVEDLNKLPLCVHRWSDHPTALFVHHLFGRTAFSAAAWPIAAVVYSMERLLGVLYRTVPVVAVSESTAAELAGQGIPASNIWVIPNGVEPPREEIDSFRQTPWPPELLFVGRLQRYKRVDLLLRAMAHLRKRGVDARLQIAGDGAMRSRLQRLAMKLRLGDRVRFLGYISESEKSALFSRAAIHVIASAKEGWGLSVLEAGIRGIPTVATHVPGLRDSVIHERTGRFVPAGDAAALADAVEALLRQPRLRRALGVGARRFAATHTWDATVDETEAFLASVSAETTTRSVPARLAQRPPFQNATPPRLGSGHAPYGAERMWVTIEWPDRAAHVSVVLGSADAAGRWPAIEFEDLSHDLANRLRAPVGAATHRYRNTVVWELLAWPTPPLAWLAQQLKRGFGARDVRVWRAPPFQVSQSERPLPLQASS